MVYVYVHHLMSEVLFLFSGRNSGQGVQLSRAASAQHLSAAKHHEITARSGLLAAANANGKTSTNQNRSLLSPGKDFSRSF